jgi:hypothetical protein
LYAANTDSSLGFLADGTLQLFDDNFSNNIDGLDLKKANNFLENISLKVSNSFLSIETREPIHRYDTVQYDIKQMRQRNYKLVIASDNFNTNGMHGFVEDNFTGARVPLNLNGETALNFSVTSEPASFTQDRFRIVFENTNASVLPLSITNIQASKQGETIKVEWKVENEINIKDYELQRSEDGIHFYNIIYTPASDSTNAVKFYAAIDLQPLYGNNFYRIRSIALSEEQQYSRIVNVVNKKEASITILSNAIAGNKIALKFNAVKKGIYKLRLLNDAGQTIFMKAIKHPGGSSIENLSYSNFLPGGIYKLEITGAGTKKIFDVLHE